ncbi:MAG TPA: hypothetical protein VHO24_14655 [Opitutaceae bacterium]|nr:hypothetical protein [Opitutaceae bacterium]
MNTEVLDKPIVLSLNRAWQVIGHRTVKQALIALNGGTTGLPPALGVDVAYPKLEDGSWNFDRPLYLNPVPWDEWVKLPVRDFDFSISTPKFHVRVPTVIVSTQFDRMPLRTPRVSRAASVAARRAKDLEVPRHSKEMTLTRIPFRRAFLGVPLPRVRAVTAFHPRRANRNL